MSDTHKPATDATESITVSRNASLQDSVLGPLSKLTNPLNLTARIPTIQDLVGELADVTGIDALKDVKLSNAGDSIELPINFSLDPVKFTEHLHLGTSIAGLKLSAMSDFNIEIDPKFHFTLGVQFGGDVPIEQRVYIMDDDAKEATLGVKISLDNPTASGTIGFLDVKLAEDGDNSGVSINGNVTVNLKDPGGDGRIIVTELTPSNLVKSFQAGIDATFAIDPLKITAELGSGADTVNLGQINISLPSTHVTSLSDLSNLSPNITGQTGFENFQNITPQMVVQALLALIDKLRGLGAGGVFDTRLPLINKSLSDLLKSADTLATKLGSFNEGMVPSAKSLQQFLQAQLGPSVTVTVGQDAISFKLHFSQMVSDTEPLNLNLGDSWGLLKVTSMGDLTLDGSADVDLGFGIRTGANIPLDQRLFLSTSGTDASGINLSGSANIGYGVNSSKTFDADVQVGILNFKIVDARALLDVTQLGGSLKDPGNSGEGPGRLTFKEIADNIASSNYGAILNGNFDGRIQALIPLDGDGSGTVAFPSTSISPGDALIELAGKLQNLPNGFETSIPFDFTAPDALADLTQPPFSTSNKVLIYAHNLDSLIGSAVLNFNNLIDGLEKLIDWGDKLLGVGALDFKLPFIGKSLDDALNFFKDNNGALQTLINTLTSNNITGAQSNDAALMATASKILTLLPAGSTLDYDKDGAGRILAANFHTTLLSSFTLPIGSKFDLGLDFLDVNSDAALQVSGTIALNLGFGVSKANNGFYLLTDQKDAQGHDIPEIQVNNLKLSVSGGGTISMGFLNLSAQFDPMRDFLSANLGININGIDDNKLTLDELTDFTNLSKIVDSTPATPGLDGISLGVQAQMDVPLTLDAGSDPNLPKLGTTFHLRWGPFTADDVVNSTDAFTSPLVELDSLKLDPGAVVQRMVQPFLDDINKYNILAPVLDKLNAPLPVIGGTLADLLGINDNPGLHFLLTVLDTINQLDSNMSGVDGLSINFGNVAIPRDRVIANPTSAGTVVDSMGHPVSTESNPKSYPGGQLPLIGGVIRDLGDAGVTFPVLQLGTLMQLFMGNNADLVFADLSGLHVSKSFDEEIPIYSVGIPYIADATVNAFFGGSIDLYANLTAGIDTTGLKAGHLLDGIYLGDFDPGDNHQIDPTDAERPELSIVATLSAGLNAKVSVLGFDLAKVTGTASIGGEIDLDLNDDDDMAPPPFDNRDQAARTDGKFHLNEISTVINANGGDPFCMFDLTGSVFAKLAFEIHIPGPNPDWSHTWTLWKFQQKCQPVLVTADYADIVGTQLVLTSKNSDTLKDNNTYAATNFADGDNIEITRVDKNDDPSDGAETLRIRKNGFTDDFGPLESGNNHIDDIDSFTLITNIGSGSRFQLVNFGQGDDAIDVDPLLRIPVLLAGGDGNDQITVGDGGGGIIIGGPGNDYITIMPSPAPAGIRNHPGAFGPAGFDLEGDAGDDQISGGGGDDTVSGGEGNDTLDGGGGNNAGSGLDVIVGGGGDDVIDGRGENDVLVGDYDASFEPRPAPASADEGSDFISAGGGADLVWGDNRGISGSADGPQPLPAQVANDYITGGDGSDTIFAGAGDDTVDTGPADAAPNRAFGGTGNDSLSGGDDADSLVGQIGNDLLEGNGGDDQIYAGDDTFGPNSSDQGFDVLIGDAGNDLLDGSDANAVTATGGDGTDSILGSRGADNLSGDADRDYIVGGPNNDLIAGGTGNDDIIGGKGSLGGFSYSVAESDGADNISGDGGNDMILGDNGTIDSSTRAATSDASGGAGSDGIFGDAGADSIIGGGLADNLDGGDDADVLLGDQGSITSAAITPTPSATGGAEVMSGGAGADILIGGDDADNMDGGSENDLLFGDYGTVNRTQPANTNFVSTNTTTTTGGGDLIHGGSGDDTAIGGQNGDYIYGDDGNDDLIGGHNVASGSDGSDSIDGGADNDVIAGDNASIIRRTTTTSITSRTLAGATLYTGAGAANVSGAPQVDPRGVATGRDIVLFDHLTSTPASVYGNDYIAGGAGNDMLFGQLGNDIMQGDGSTTLNVSATQPSSPAASNGDDYMEGNGGSDVMYGDLGQDDMIGGSSNLFGFDTAAKRTDGADVIYGGAGTDVTRDADGDISATGHGRDADVILGDNGNIYRIGGAGFNYDNYSASKIIVRAVTLLDYTPGTGAPADIGAADLMLGGDGDDQIYGQVGNDVLFGNGQDDDIYGGAGSDRIYGGAGDDGILGDDGRVATSRNGSTEPLYGLTLANAQSNLSIPGPFTGAVEFIPGLLLKTATLSPANSGANDVIYGGRGNDFIHAGAGDDAVSGAEAQVSFYTTDPVTNTNVLGYNTATRKLAAYNANDALSKVNNFLLNFDGTTSAGAKIDDGKDRIFGDTGNDWLVGGTGHDRLFGGPGDDLMNADDNLETNGGLNNQPDAPAFADADFVFGGAGLDVMIANTGADRLFDWVGEFNSYIVPFSKFGDPTVVRSPSPNLQAFVLSLGRASGADQTTAEPNGELGLVSQGDPQWSDQHGPPRDPQPGNTAGSKRDTLGGPEDDSKPAATVSPQGKAVSAGDVTAAGVNSLYVFGTWGNDAIDVHASTSKSGYIEVTLNGKVLATVNKIYSIYIWGDAGDDNITIQPSAGTARAFIYGEAGNDSITAGAGSAYIDAGAGDDVVKGGSARNILIGGAGADSLTGGGADDMLVGGTLNYIEWFDAQTAILAEWTRSDASYKNRISDLRAGSGLGGGYGIGTATVIDDSTRDSIFGAAGVDWFLGGTLDLTDRKSNGSDAETFN